MAIESIFAFGFSHHQLDIASRSKVSFDESKQNKMFVEVLNDGVQSLIILNTCNRTEIYGIGDVAMVKDIFFTIAKESQTYEHRMFEKNGQEAIDHILKVACGVDSKIIGDLEILGQLKRAIFTSKSIGLCSGLMQRITNQCITAAKEVRTKTQLASGTISASYAVVKKIKEHFGEQPLRILIIGIGKFGVSIAKNIVQHLPKSKLTLTNRTDEKAETLSKELAINYVDFSNYGASINDFDIVITSAYAENGYLVNVDQIRDMTRLKWLIDMSVPLAINPDILSYFPKLNLLNLDQVTNELESTIESRLSELPAALQIIHTHSEEIIDKINWNEKSRIIKIWKNKIMQMSNDSPHLQIVDEPERNLFIEKSIKEFAKYIRTSDLNGKSVETTIEAFLKLQVEAQGKSNQKNSFNDVKESRRTCQTA
jgi:glutamyl-tRNA reductase